MKWWKLLAFLFLYYFFYQSIIFALTDDATLSPTYKASSNVINAPHILTSNTIDSPIRYTAKDSMIMILDSCNTIYLFGESSIQYKAINLTGEHIEVQVDSGIIFATFGLDSLGQSFGYPILKENEVQCEMKKFRYNIKTQKMFIHDMIFQSEEGYITAPETKKMSDDIFFIKNGRYTTCDDHKHPHFYFQLTKAKINKKKKKIITGPAYLVIEGVPTPIFIPFGFFTLPKEKYYSGFILPNYSNEITRGFSLSNGGYYFAINQYIDLLLTGEIFSKGSCGLDAFSRYRKRYKYSGNILVSFHKTILGEKKEGNYKNFKDFKLKWVHNQDIKANPHSTFSANMNYSTNFYNQNNLESLYSDIYTQNAKFSSINYIYKPYGSIFYYNLNSSVYQTLQDSTFSFELPNISIFMHDIYPFRKRNIEKQKWINNIRINYKGVILNSIQDTKIENLFKKDFSTSWKNGIKQEVPIKTSFHLLKNIIFNFSIQYTDYLYPIFPIYKFVHLKLNSLDSADSSSHYFNRAYSYNSEINTNTKLYGIFKPCKLFGALGQKFQIRHAITPLISFTQSYNHFNFESHKINYSNNKYFPWIIPEQSRENSLNISVDNNLEMKYQSKKTDHIHKISLIDQLKISISYNFLLDSMNWSDLSTFFRFKGGSTCMLNIQGNFDPYLYDEQGNKINIFHLNSTKKIFHGLKYMKSSFSYTLSHERFKKWFKKNNFTYFSNNDSISKYDNNESAICFGQKSKKNDSEYDSDGYLFIHIPWSLSFNYFLSLNQDLNSFSPTYKKYTHKINQNLGISGNINLTKNWSFNCDANYDFDHKKLVTMNCSIFRKLHCWNMSANIISIGHYQSYQFTISANSSVLKDLKYSQSNNFRDVINWGNKK